MFMEIIYSDAGNTDEVIVIRQKMIEALESNDNVLVKFLQPGIMYQENGNWKTVVDLMNEFKGKPITFESNLVPLKRCEASFNYTNDMFMTGPLLYQKNDKCMQ